MLRSVSFGLVSFAALIAASSGAMAESFTTRIEPQPYQGATVTIEHNVRVYRPLPAIKHVIINPNQTPLNLSFAEVVEHRQSQHYYYDYSRFPGVGYAGGVGFPPPFHAKPSKERIGGFRP